ncbi:NADH dehydrogenase subunit N [Roseivivax halodurans JCM 10272]|uniref:NADH dehydrogenase subunit N n=1 Tax=Roseivivax halodurans JCM 10272 TaxID=1449350 RepID=X7EKA3_9RHOB|nr:hypothetical protein [Roseivivax halodurans]ETX16519.1 NADH dehydrogenase subunit N [Roseivivax halodurans JCM 10272]
MISARGAALLVAMMSAVPAGAAEVIADSLEETAALGEELRELFHLEPELVGPALGSDPGLATEIAQGLYADEIASDLARIEGEAAALFSRDRPLIGAADGPVKIALLVGQDCPDCAAAERDLDELAQRVQIAATVIDVSQKPEDRAMMERLTLDMVPAYVMADKMIRGHMPTIVLERYLGE